MLTSAAWCLRKDHVMHKAVCLHFLQTEPSFSFVGETHSQLNQFPGCEACSLKYEAHGLFGRGALHILRSRHNTVYSFAVDNPLDVLISRGF
jgi:hypothetical protein